MKRRLIQPPQVEDDLAGLSDYIARSSVSAALRFLDAAENAFQRLAEFPEIGSLWEPENPRLFGLRIWPIPGFEKYLTFYRPSGDAVEIVHVLHGARDFESLFGG